MAFRDATYDDIPAVMIMVRAAQQALHDLGIDQWQNGYPAADDIRADIERGVGRVLEDDGILLAYGAVVYTGEPAYCQISDEEWLTSGDYVVLHRLCVNPDNLRHGVASQFFQCIERESVAQGVRSFRVDTHSGNVRMLGLIAKCGFTLCGTVVYSSGSRLAYEKII